MEVNIELDMFDSLIIDTSRDTLRVQVTTDEIIYENDPY